MSGLCVLGHGVGANDEPLHREAEPGSNLCAMHLATTNRCVRCGWWLGGTAADPVQPPKDMACYGMGAAPCAADWLSGDPEDIGTYDEYLTEVGHRKGKR